MERTRGLARRLLSRAARAVTGPGGHQTSSARANQVNDFAWGRQAAALLLGIDPLAVDENVERPWRAHADASRNLQFVFDALFQAHGLRLDFGSKETALDFDGHSFAHTTTHVTREPGSISSRMVPRRYWRKNAVTVHWRDAALPGGAQALSSPPTPSIHD